MKLQSPLVAAAAAGVCALALAAAAPTQAIHIRFEAVVGSHPFKCGQTYAGIGKTQAAITPEFFRFYVSRVRLVDAQGHQTPLALDQDGTWQQRDVAFLSFEDSASRCANGSPQMHDEVVGTAPPGNYTAIVFTLGVPEDLNHADATIANSPLNITEMFWSWQDGYKFLRLDTRVVGKNGHSVPYVFHLGSMRCTMSGKAAHCNDVNRPEIALNHFSVGKSTIVVDVAKLLNGADLEHYDPNGSPGCMSMAMDNCGAVMANIGVAFGANPAGTQAVFRVR